MAGIVRRAPTVHSGGDRELRSGTIRRGNESAQGVCIRLTGFPTGRSGSRFHLIRIVGFDREQYERFMSRGQEKK